jgi:hypothetical protein
MSMRALSTAAGLTPGHVEQIVNRRQDPESLEMGTVVRLANAGGVRVDWLLTGNGPRDATEPAAVPGPTADSPAPPPISDTYVSDDRVDALFDQASVPGLHTRGDERLVREVVHRHSNLLSDDIGPVDYVRKLLDTAAKCREQGRKVAPDELYDLTFKIVADELVVTSRALREAQARLDEMLAEAREKAKEMGVELRIDGDGTPHPALVAGIAAAKAKRRQ